ncbi:peptidase, partial [Burkholderia mallei]
MTGGDPAPGRRPDTERLSFFRAARPSDLDQAKAANAPRAPRRDARRARVAECRPPSS